MKNNYVVLLVVYVLSTTVVFSRCEPGRVGRWVRNWYESHSVQQYDVSCDQYPNATAYFEGLKNKYPTALGSVCIKMVHDERMGPCCIGKTILFSQGWIQELEDGNHERLLQTEWVLLHEAGHVYYGHSITSGLLQMLPVGFMSSFMILYIRWRAEPQADNFACEHCQNVAAMQAVIDWFQKEAVNDLAHPTIKSRIAKIEKAMKTKKLA